MNRNVFAFLVIAFAGLSVAYAQDAHAGDKSGEMRVLTASETATVSSLTPVRPGPANQWGFMLVAPNAPINVAGLPADRAFTRTTLVYAPSTGEQGDNPTAVTLVIMWPEGSVDRNGDFNLLRRVTGVRLNTNDGRAYWAFDVQDRMDALLREGAEWYVEQDGARRRFLNLGPNVFNVAAWAHVDERLGLGDVRIDVGEQRPDGGRGLALRPSSRPSK